MRQKLLYIIVVCSLWACDDLIEVEDISNKNVHLLAPIDNATLNSNVLTFSWNPIEGADSYHLQIAQPSFEEAHQIVRDTLVDKVNFSDSLVTNTYQWRVRAENYAYISEYTTNTLTIE